MERIWQLEPRHHGRGSVVYSWQPSCEAMASSGPSKIVHIVNCQGRLLGQIPPHNNSPVLGLEWDCSSTHLAILYGGPAHQVCIWQFNTREVQLIDLNIKEPTFIKWSKVAHLLAIGSSRGELIIYDRSIGSIVSSAWRHKKRIVAADWSLNGKLATAGEDRQITITAPDGKTFGQVKVKSRPTNVKFGGNEPDRENIVSVSMDRKTILLYNLDDPENALELAFQARYGSIVSFKWFRDGYVMVGFSLGYLVVISTHLEEIGREQFCARFHRDGLRELAYAAVRHQLCTAAEHQIKRVDMHTWKEIDTLDLDKAAGVIEKVSWSLDGRFISVSTRNGFLFVYAVEPNTSNIEPQGALGSGFGSWSLSRPLSRFNIFSCSCIIMGGLAMLANSWLGATPYDLYNLAFYSLAL